MSITYVIPGATLLDQLNDATMDGMPDEDAQDNCVPTSIAEGLHILTGRTFDGDELKDAVYGQGYVGFQSASRYVAYCAAQGVTLTAHNDTQAGLVAFIHAEVSAGHPVVLTMPSQWGTAPADPVHPSGSTHVGVAVGVGAGEIRVMNPWQGFWQDQTDSWWQARLCEGQVWLMQKASTNVSGVPSGWDDDGVTLTGAPAPDGKRYPVVRGIRALILAENHDPTDVPIGPEFSVALVEYGHQSLGAGVVQFFLKSGQRSWTQALGTFATYNGQEESALRQALSTAEAATATAQAAATAAQANVTAAQQQRDALSSQLQQAQQSAQQAAQVAQAQAQQDQQTIAQLRQQLAAAQATPPTPAPAPAPVATPAPTTPADAAALLVTLIYAEAAATLKAATPAG